MPRPVVIRLVTYVRIPRDTHRRKITRRAVFARDDWTCQYCGARSNLTVDHVIPRSKGGPSSWENIVASCAPCNRRKGDALPHQVGMQLLKPAADAEPARVHPRRQPDDPGGLAAVPGGVAGLRPRSERKSRRQAVPLASGLIADAEQVTVVGEGLIQKARRAPSTSAPFANSAALDRGVIEAGGTTSGAPHDGVSVGTPLSGASLRPSGRTPPGSRKNYQTGGPPPFSGSRNSSD